MRTKLFLVVSLLVASILYADAQKIIEVLPADAKEHLEKSAAATYPAIAKAARIQGKVVLKTVISKEGSVAEVKPLSGHPMLVQAAIDAVTRWRYAPFMVDGAAVSVSTTVEVPFGLEPSKTEQQVNESYFQREDKCRELIRGHQFAEAEVPCKTALDLAEKLPSDRQNERRAAYQNTGHSFFFQKKFTDALSLYQHELSISEASLKPYEAELGYAYHDVALGLHATGDLKQARSYYERAEKTLEQAREHIGSVFLKNHYSQTIQSVLRDHAVLLRQTGDISAAEVAEQKARSVPVKTDLKDE